MQLGTGGHILEDISLWALKVPAGSFLLDPTTPLPMPNRLALLCAALLVALPASLQAQSSPEPREVVVNEILYAPSPSQNEFIELYNRSPQPVDLSTLSFSDNREEPNTITATSTLLPPGGYAVLVRDATLFAAAFPDVPFLTPPNWDALNNSGDAVVLYRGSTVIDRVPYAPDWGGSDGRSLERIDPASPSDQSRNFGSSADPRGATPGRENSLFAPDRVPPIAVFAAVPAPDTVLAVFDEPIAQPPPDAFSLDDGTSPTAVRHGPADDRVRLPFARPVTGLHLRIEGVRDLVGNALSDTSIALAYPPADGDLALSEIMFDPRADDFDNRPNQPEYFEITNRSSRALSMRGLFWTDVPDETGAADTMRIGDRVLKTLPPGGWAVVYAEPEPANDPAADGALAASFPKIDFRSASVTLLPIPRASLSLRNDGDLIRLHASDGRPIATVNYRPDWHVSSLADASGVALERISLTAPAAARTNWTSSVASAGGTPGRPNSVRVASDATSEQRLTVTPSPFSPDGDGIDDVTRIAFRLNTDVATVRVRIYDAAGRHVRTLEESRIVGRTGELLWDGRGDGGRSLRIGIYVILFEALDAQGGQVVTLKRPVVVARPLN